MAPDLFGSLEAVSLFIAPLSIRRVGQANIKGTSGSTPGYGCQTGSNKRRLIQSYDASPSVGPAFHSGMSDFVGQGAAVDYSHFDKTFIAAVEQSLRSG